jgi:glycosyltransferase involved in cell wall biosynthesis
MLLERRGFLCEDAMLDTGAPSIASIPSVRDQSCIRLVSAGRLERRKGLELALRAFAMASPRLAEWRFTIIGDGPDGHRLRRMSEDLGISSHVVFAGQKSHPDTLEMLRGSDAFVFTSIRDTSGSVNLEAMANGLPVICIAHQGVGDITNDECALRIAPASIAATVHALCDAILKISADGDLAKRLGNHAAMRASRDFSWDSKFDAMVNHYHRAALAKQPAGIHTTRHT